MANENTNIVREQGGNTIRIGDMVLTFDGTDVLISGLPTSDPGKAGALWLNSNVLTRSAG